MRRLTTLLAAVILAAGAPAEAQVSDAELQALRAQIERLTARLDALEKQNRELARSAQSASAGSAAAAAAGDALDERIDQRIAARVDDHMDAVSWAERMRWKGDFRYRYENIDEQGRDGRNRNRIRARAVLQAQVTPNVEVGLGLATGGEDPVSGNQTLGGGGSRKDIGLDLAYFNWSGLTDTNIIGGKFENFLVTPQNTGLLWDGDWRPEGVGAIWDNGTFFVQGLGTWLEGDSRRGTEFAWVAQGGVNLVVGETGKLMFGGGYSKLDIAGRVPVFGDPDDFFGNSFVVDPATGNLVYAHDYHQLEAFAEYSFKLHGRPLVLFADYVVNTEADDNDTGYLFGAKYGSAKSRGTWDFAYFYKKLEADAVLGLLADSDFGGGGTDSKGHVLQGTYALDDNWTFKTTYFINEIDLASGDPRDFDRLMLDLSYKYK